MRSDRIFIPFYIGILALIAVSGTAGALRLTPPLHPQYVLLALVYAGLVTTAFLFPLPFAFKTKLCLDTGVIFAAVLLFTPGISMLIAGVGTLAAQVVRRRSGRQIVFNGAQTALQAAAAAGILAVGGWEPSQLRSADIGYVHLLIGAALAMYLVNTLSVATMVGLQTRQSPLRFWHSVMLRAGRVEHLTHCSQVGLGYLAAVVTDSNGWTLILLVIPIFAVYTTLKHHIQIMKQAEEAQRIARFGDWVWDLDTGVQVWSDEMYRIFGYAPQAFVPTFETFLNAVHPDDRVRVGATVHRALSARDHYSIDHRILQPDGTSRIVHEQGEVISDEHRPRRMIVAVHDITERKALEERLAHQAYHDALTGLPNRAFFLDRLQSALAHTSQQRRSVAVLFLDLDRFKVINDSLGHEAGDRVLVVVAERLRASLRSGAVAARFGGDEFTILLPEVGDVYEVCRAAERILAAVRAPFALDDGHEASVTSSIGIVLNDDAHPAPADLLRDADVAMYRAKQSGKACYKVFDTSMHAWAVARLDLERDLRQAIARGEMRLYYQPIVRLATRRIVGLEALLRWQHPQRGTILPAEFIPLAEETGLIVPLGRWALRTACRQAATWHRAHPSGDPVAINVNLSATQFQQPNLIAEVADALRATGLDPHHLVLEITESVMMADGESTGATLTKLKALGVRLAIDDFGTGYSSLSYLNRFPVDILKIDRSFVARLGEDGEGASLARAILSLGHGLGLRVIAEGIERGKQAAQLRMLGCELGQGYHFAAPLASEAAGRLLAEAGGAADERAIGAG